MRAATHALVHSLWHPLPSPHGAQGVWCPQHTAEPWRAPRHPHRPQHFGGGSHQVTGDGVTPSCCCCSCCSCWSWPTLGCCAQRPPPCSAHRCSGPAWHHLSCLPQAWQTHGQPRQPFAAGPQQTPPHPACLDAEPPAPTSAPLPAEPRVQQQQPQWPGAAAAGMLAMSPALLPAAAEGRVVGVPAVAVAAAALALLLLWYYQACCSSCRCSWRCLLR
jgi:hypothetical protein